MKRLRPLVFGLALLGACNRLPVPDAVRFARGVKEERLHRTVNALAGFDTRHTASEDIKAARAWLKREFETIASGAKATMRVEEHVFASVKSRRLDEGVEVGSVYAVLEGTASERMFVVSGHYDSRASDVMDANAIAPGANDDASGVAVVLELARLFAAEPPEATIVFLCVAGEEQGLLGSRAFARHAREQGWTIDGMFTNDIVGNSMGPDGVRRDGYVRVFSEGLPSVESPMGTRLIRNLGAESDSPSRQLARAVEEAARVLRGMEVKLVFRHDRFLRGGDHMAFNEAGYAAVRFTEPFENYARQHKDVSETEGDLAKFVDFAYLARVAQVNALALRALANAPAAPRGAKIHAQQLENATTLSWDASPEKDLAHYEVVWRDTTAAVWTHARKVEGTQVALPLSKDNWHFGVRAVDADGHKSLVAYPAPLRR